MYVPAAPSKFRTSADLRSPQLERISYIDAEGLCHIGYSHALSYGLIGALLATEGSATVAFVLPVWRSSFSNARALARRSTISSTVALITSLANYLYLPLVGGSVQAWIYAVCILGDSELSTLPIVRPLANPRRPTVTLNAYVMFFLTTSASSSPAPSRPPLSPTVGQGSIPLHLALESLPVNSSKDKSKMKNLPLSFQSMLESGEEQHMVELRRESAPRREEWEGEHAV